MLTAFIDKLPEHIDGDGKVRPHWNNCGTVTGRMSCSDPNLQQLPKTSPDMPIDFKSVFMAPEGRSFVSLDYSGQELRILAIISKDEVLMEAFKSGKDLHLMTANEVFDLGIPEEALCTSHPDYEEYKKKYKHERHIGKNGFNFPIIYGTTAYGIAKNVGITEEEAERGIEKFYGTYPGVRRAIRRCHEFLKHNFHVRSLTLRRRRLDAKEKKSYRQAFNFLIQSLASDMLRCACNKIRKLFLKHPEWEAKFIMLVHDEIVVEVKDEYVEEVMNKIRPLAENAMKLPLRMEVDMGFGKVLSELK